MLLNLGCVDLGGETIEDGLRGGIRQLFAGLHDGGDRGRAIVLRERGLRGDRT